MEHFAVQLPTGAPLSLVNLLINLAIGVPLALILRWHFERFGSTLSNREEFAQVFPFILLTTTLIITIVKSSLALSLGLVGALSIVRFRTPIKEPEELAYLFFSISMGLGLGADQTVPTVVAGLVILTVIAALRMTRRRSEKTKLYLSVDLEGPGGNPDRIDSLNELIARHVRASDLRRLDARDGGLEATYFVDVDESNRLSALIDELNRAVPGIGVSFIDQSRLPTV
ncbi:MAG: DUF4956 domain-containing protein [Myxococcota bacterium]